MALPKRVYIREVGPREGLQILGRDSCGSGSEGALFSTQEKSELISRLAATGVPEIEVASMVRADRVPQMADADELIASMSVNPLVRYTALYLNPQGFERAEALGKLRNQGWLYTATSDSFLSKNANTSRAKIIAGLDAWLELFKRHGKVLHGVMISTAFGCGYEGLAASDRLLEVSEEILGALAERGVVPAELSFADTVGLGSPELVRERVQGFRSRFPKIRLSLHLHDTRGLGIANAYAGLLEGIDCFDASLGGMGGCPFTPGAAGNVATEDLLYLCQQLRIETSISLDAYVETVRWFSALLEKKLLESRGKDGSKDALLMRSSALSGKYFRAHGV